MTRGRGAEDVAIEGSDRGVPWWMVVVAGEATQCSQLAALCSVSPVDCLLSTLPSSRHRPTSTTPALLLLSPPPTLHHHPLYLDDASRSIAALRLLSVVHDRCSSLDFSSTHLTALPPAPRFPFTVSLVMRWTTPSLVVLTVALLLLGLQSTTTAASASTRPLCPSRLSPSAPSSTLRMRRRSLVLPAAHRSPPRV